MNRVEVEVAARCCPAVDAIVRPPAVGADGGKESAGRDVASWT